MGIQTYPKQEGQKDFDFYVAGFRGLLNVNSMPQSVADDDVIVAQNLYGSQEGGLFMRKGIKTRGAVLENSSIIKGLFRFEQQVVNAAPQNPSIVKLLAQVGTTNSAGGDLWDVDNNVQIGAANVVGSAALPWSAQMVFDPDHQQSPPTKPTIAANAGAGLVSGVYTYEVTAVTAAGESLPSLPVSIITLVTGTITVSWTRPPGAAVTGYKVYGRVAGSLGLMSDGTIGSPATLSYTDTGAGTVGAAPPTTSTSGAQASDVLVICTGSGGPYVYDGSIVYVPAAWTTNCPAARWCQVVNNILYFGGISIQPNLIVGMGLGHPETLATAGQNNFTFSHQVQGLAIFGAGATAGLVVGLTQGLAVVYGTGLQNFYEQEVPSFDGVAAGRTMITVDGYVYFLGRDDIYVFDGTAIQPMGQKVRPYILNDPLFTNSWDIPMSGARGLSWAMYYNRRIYFWYDTGNVGNPNCALVWDMNLHGWTTLVGESLNAACLLDASSDGSPLACVVGGATTAQCYNFDVYNGTGHNVDDAGTGVSVLLNTKFYKIGQPGTDKRLIRAYVEMFLESFSGVIVVNTDYGAQSTNAVVAASTLAGAVWDVSLWDASSWSGGFLQFVDPRSDFDAKFEALSLGIFSNAVQAPMWIQGFSGRCSQNTMTG